MPRSVSVILLCMFGVAARVYGLIRFPFEQDELYTIDEATNLLHTRLLPGIQARPVFFVLQHPVAVWFRDTPIVLRVLPFICGILGIWITYLLARRVIGTLGANVAAVLVAVSPWHLYASSFARYYSLVYCLAALVYWRLPIAYESDRPRDYLGVLAALLIGAWTHPSFAFPVAGAALVVMIVSGDGRRAWRWPTPSAWMYLWGPFLLVSCAGFVLIRVTTHATVSNGAVRDALSNLRLIPAMIEWMTPIVCAIALAGAIALIRFGDGVRRQFGIMAIAGVSAMLLALVPLSFVTAIYADYGIAALPLILVSAAGGVAWIVEQVPAANRRFAEATIVVLLLVGIAPSAASYLSDGTRFDYRPAFARIERDAPARTVLAWPIIMQRHYAPQLHTYEVPFTADSLSLLLNRERDLWAIMSVKRYGIATDDGNGTIARWLGEHCRQIDQYQHPRVDYRMYRVDLWRCTSGQS